MPIPPVILPVVESVAAANVIVVTFATVFIFIPLDVPDQGMIENPTLPIVGPEVNIAMSPFDCRLLNAPEEIFGSMEIVFPLLIILNAELVPCGAVSVTDTNVLTAEFADITSLLVTIFPPDTLPDALTMPVTYWPVDDQTTTLEVPATPTVMLALAVLIDTLLLPLVIALNVPLTPADAPKSSIQ